MKPNEVAQDKSRLSSIRHRRRLGYFLLLMATCFGIMWGPYTTCEFYDLLDKDAVSLEIMQLTQCIGLLHSGISPFLAMASMDKDWSKGLSFQDTKTLTLSLLIPLFILRSFYV